MLAELGYRVLKAVDAASALNVIESGVKIDLLFTDVVMPGTLKSPELARMAKQRLPDIAVLFTSGYTENSIVHGGKLDAGIELISKPYSREALARRVRHVLANEQQRRGLAAAAPTLVAPPRTAVLLVEDDAMIRNATSDMLQEAGFLVVDAASAEDALVALQTSGIDVLVTDVNLPNMTGPELAAKAREIRPGIATVYATGDRHVAADGPRSALVVKPYTVGALLRAVAAASGARAHEKGAGKTAVD